MTEHLDDSTQQFAPLFGANNAVSGTVADSVDAAASDSIQGDEMWRRRIWPWVVIACLLVALGAACGGGVWFFHTGVLPGTTLWGNSVTGKTEPEIVDLINDQVDNTAVRAKYQGQSATFTLKDLASKLMVKQSHPMSSMPNAVTHGGNSMRSGLRMMWPRKSIPSSLMAVW